MSFTFQDIGGCGCTPAACTNAALFPVGGGNNCCICAVGLGNMNFTLNAAFAGSTTYSLSWLTSSAWPGWYVAHINYGPNDSTGTAGTFFSNCFTDGTNSYQWVYNGQPVLAKFTGTSCAPGLYVGLEQVSQTGMSGYQCSPSFTATYAVTSGQTWLYGAGVTSIQAAGPYGYPLCCMYKTVLVGCNSTAVNGLTVNWWTNSGMGTLISTGAGGSFLGVGSAATWYRQIIAAPRFNNPSPASKAVTCGSSDNVTLTVATGYHCLIGSGCEYPLPGTLYCTFASAGARVFTYAAGAWSSSFTYLGVAYVIGFDTSMNITVATANGVDFSAGTNFYVDSCPVVGPFLGEIDVPSSGTGSALGTGMITE